LTTRPGQGVEAFRPIRDEIKTRVEALIAELTSQPAASGGC
jgi:arsenate reductase